MQSILILVCAVEWIEQNLTSELDVESVAKESYVSSSYLQKLFSRVFHCSVWEYITKRRLSCAARDLCRGADSVTEVAFRYQYASIESFTRAFKKQFAQAPSVYRRNSDYREIYPKARVEHFYEKRGQDIMKTYDATELSAPILAAKGTYVLNADVDHLMHINDTLGHEAGDAALAATAERIKKHLGKGMETFRIGGDQFIVLTGSAELAAAERLAQQIISYAAEDVGYSGGSFQFSISIGICYIPADLSDARAAIAESNEAMYDAKRKSKGSYSVR